MSTIRPVHRPPSVLYKYYPPARVEVFENHTVRFSAPSEFNDTFDTQYSAHASGPKEVMQHHKFRSAIGIFCLTEEVDDPLMWTHYAHNHTGFVIGFDRQAKFFSDEARLLGPVHYTGEPGRIDARHRPGDADELQLCFYKARDWEREREWRCVKQFKQGESRSEFFEDPTFIRQVIIGHKADASLIAEIMRSVTLWEMHHVEFYLSTPDKARWKFSHERRAYSLCEHCDGKGYTDGQL